MDEIFLRLPYPPLSGNNQHDKTRRGIHLRPEIFAYRAAVRAVASAAGVADGNLAGPLWVEIQAHPPRRGRFDQDNFLKVALDAITKAGIWTDDSNLVVPLTVFHWKPHRPGGCIDIWFRGYDGADDDYRAAA